MDAVIFTAAITDLVRGGLIALWIFVFGYALISFIIRPFVQGWRRSRTKNRTIHEPNINLAFAAILKRNNL